jgi:CheY-like chemotaxis protein/DNA-binding MarR family transcriptional regulator
MEVFGQRLHHEDLIDINSRVLAWPDRVQVTSRTDDGPEDACEVATSRNESSLPESFVACNYSVTSSFRPGDRSSGRKSSAISACRTRSSFVRPGIRSKRSQRDEDVYTGYALSPATQCLPPIKTMAEVLLLDDDPAMLVFLEGILSPAGYICHAQADPQAALSQVASRQEIGLVLSDVYMPGMTGLQFIHRIHGLRLGRPAPPVLLLTAQPSVESAIDALRLGAEDFLLKPVRPTELIEAVEQALSRSRGDRTVGTARSPQIDQLVRQAEELAGRLRNLADAEDEQPVDIRVPAPAPQQVEEPVALLSVLDTIEQLRRLRNLYTQHSLDDLDWDLLLELLRAERLQQRMSVSALTIVPSGVSTTTSLRRVNQLVARGYMIRVPDARDARRDFVSLTSKSNDLLTDYLTRANALLRNALPVGADPGEYGQFTY